MYLDRLLRVRAVDYPIAEIERPRAGNPAAEIVFQYPMVDRREIPVDVGAQHEAVTVPVALVALQGAMRALAHSVGVAVEDEATLEQGLDDGAQRVVHDPVAERCGRDHPRLGILDAHCDIAAGLPTATQQFAFEPQALGFEASHKAGSTQLAPLAAHSAPRRRHQGGKRSDLGKEIVMPVGHRRSSTSRRRAVRHRRARVRHARSAWYRGNASPSPAGTAAAISRRPDWPRATYPGEPACRSPRPAARSRLARSSGCGRRAGTSGCAETSRPSARATA